MQIQNNLISAANNHHVKNYFLGSSCIYPNFASTNKERIFDEWPPRTC